MRFSLSFLYSEVINLLDLKTLIFKLSVKYLLNLTKSNPFLFPNNFFGLRSSIDL